MKQLSIHNSVKTIRPFSQCASPTEPQVVAIDIKSCKAHVLALGVKHQCGCAGLMPDKLSKDDDIWMLPYTGKVITQWNPQTGEVREYSDFPHQIILPYTAASYPPLTIYGLYKYIMVIFYVTDFVVNCIIPDNCRIPKRN